MIDEILKYCKIGVLISAFLFFISACVLIWNVYKLPNQILVVTNQTQSELLQINTILSELTLTLKEINRPCSGNSNINPCGTIADLHKTLGTVRGTFGQIEIAANHESKNLTKLDSQEEILFNDTHKTLLSSNDTLISLTNTLNTINDSSKEIKPLLLSTTNTMDEFGRVINKTNTKLDDPTIGSILTNIDSTTKHIDSISEKIDRNKKISIWKFLF